MQSKKLLRTTIAIAVFSFLGTTACIANNNLFLPGDAFFPTLLTKDGIAKMRTTNSGARTFEYVAPDMEGGAMCGYAGYANATIPSVDDAFAENLDRVYSKIVSLRGRSLIERNENGKTTITENGGMRVLFYPSGFDFQVHRIGLKYNENWVEESKKNCKTWVALFVFPNVARKPERSAAQGCGIRAIPQACPVDCYALRLP